MIDWETGLSAILNAWAQSTMVIPQRDDELLEWYARHEAAIEAEPEFRLYRDVVAESMRRMMAESGQVNDSAAAWPQRLAKSVGSWPPFPDSAEALILLRSRYRLGILSNVDHQSFQGSRDQLIAPFDLIVTAEDVRGYKPDRRNFETLLERLAVQGIRKSEILHVAQSLYHDHIPAQQLGLRTVWINRRKTKGHRSAGATPSVEGAVSDAEFPSMRAFARWATS